MEVQFTEQTEQHKLGAGATFHDEGILAITKGLLQAGVAYVGGYQGAPVSHLLDVLVQAKPPTDRSVCTSRRAATRPVPLRCWA